MRIERRDRSSSDFKRFKSAIAEAADATGVAGRVCCAACSVTCRQCASQTCPCPCTPDCPEAPRALSADPDRHPIEPAILPLVFAMKRLGLFRPCWSCEGHRRADGSLWKLPRVWFYCDSVLHLRLLAAGLRSLEFAGRLRALWQVVVTVSDPDNPDTTFALEPVLSEGRDLPLAVLQDDARQIARSLQAMVATEARVLQRAAPLG